MKIRTPASPSCTINPNTFVNGLSDDVLTDIFLTLPFKELSRLRLVCRKFERILSNDHNTFWGNYFSTRLQHSNLPITTPPPSTFKTCCDYYKQLTKLHNEQAKEFIQNNEDALQANELLKQVASQFPFVSKLYLGDFTQLSDLKPLKDLSSLTKLYLSDCTQLSDLEPLKGLSSLTTLDLSYCPKVSDLDPLKDLYSLISLDLRGCAKVSNLEPLKDLSSLTKLFLNGCDQISNISPLKDLTSLTTLFVCGCTQLSNDQIDSLEQQNIVLNFF